MIDQKKRTYHFETSSLLPLKLVLLKAERETPPHARHEQKDMNEELALKLIVSMKRKHKRLVSKPLPLEAKFQEHNLLKKVSVVEP